MKIAVLICSRADAPITVRGATFDRSCDDCGQRVMVAPSGQNVLNEHPEAQIFCTPCFMKRLPSLPENSTFSPAPGIEDEIKQLIPNTWGQRN